MKPPIIYHITFYACFHKVFRQEFTFFAVLGIILSMKKLVVNKKYDGKKLVNFLLDEFNNLKQSTVFKALRKKDIIINEKRVNENIVVYAGDEVVVYITDENLYGTTPLDIAYEDNNIIVVNKPAGISVTDNSLNEKNLTQIVQEKYKSAMPCHRLDRNTSGLVVFAKNEEALNILLEKFKSREIEKYYACIVNGIPEKSQKKLEAYLFKNNKKSHVYISDTPKTGYQKIITSYKVIDSNKTNNISLLEVKLETGRTHQIRAHLAHIGHPIIGDGKYGINEVNKKFHAKTQFLKAYKLVFNFTSDSGILEYLNGMEINIGYKDYLLLIRTKKSAKS